MYSPLQIQEAQTHPAQGEPLNNSFTDIAHRGILTVARAKVG